MTGATGGIGQAIVRALHARGATVIASGRKRRRARATSRGELGERVEPLVADLADPAQVAAPGRRAATSTCWSRTRRCLRRAGSTASPREEIDRALDVNLRAPMQLARALRAAA